MTALRDGHSQPPTDPLLRSVFLAGLFTGAGQATTQARQRDHVSGQQVLGYCIITILVVATPTPRPKHFQVFLSLMLYVLHCRVIAVAKLKICHVPSSAFHKYIKEIFIVKAEELLIITLLL